MSVKTKFQKELETFLNQNCMESDSDTPDYILAQYLVDCLRIFNSSVKARDKWWGFTKHFTDNSLRESNPK